MSGETWLVLGASSAIARAFARAAAARGDDVLLAGRDGEDLARTAEDLRLRHGVETGEIAFDATDFAAHADLAKQAQEQASGTLNIFLAFATMPEQAAMEADFELARGMVEATYLGPISVLTHLAPILEAQGRGRVVILGSVAGDRGRIKNYAYGSAKAGLHAWAAGFRARLFKAGVRVTTVKPGFIDTAMTWGEDGLFLVASPEACAEACLRFADKGVEERYFPSFWWLIMSIIKAIPEPIFKRLGI